MQYSPPKATELGARRFGRVNWLGLWTLCAREIQRRAQADAAGAGDDDGFAGELTHAPAPARA